MSDIHPKNSQSTDDTTRDFTDRPLSEDEKREALAKLAQAGRAIKGAIPIWARRNQGKL